MVDYTKEYRELTADGKCYRCKNVPATHELYVTCEENSAFNARMELCEPCLNECWDSEADTKA